MSDKIRTRLGLIIPFGLFILFAIGYTFVWNRGAEGMRAEIARFAKEEERLGRSLTYDGVAVAGYPFTLRGTVKGLSWSSPVLGTFSAEEVTIVTLPYDVSRIIFAPRGNKSLTVAGETYDLETDDLRFSLEENFVAIEAHGVTAISDARRLTLGDLVANRQEMPEGNTIAVSLKKLGLGGEEGIEVPFFDMAASEAGGTLTIAAADMGIGREGDTAPTQLAGKGKLARAASGALSGTVDLRFRNEGPLLGILGQAGAIEEEQVEVVAAMLGLMTKQGTKEIALPVVIDEGEVEVGMVPLGTLPPLNL